MLHLLTLAMAADCERPVDVTADLSDATYACLADALEGEPTVTNWTLLIREADRRGEIARRDAWIADASTAHPDHFQCARLWITTEPVTPEPVDVLSCIPRAAAVAMKGDHRFWFEQWRAHGSLTLPSPKPPANAPWPACQNLGSLEPSAAIGRLKPEQRRCLEARSARTEDDDTFLAAKKILWFDAHSAARTDPRPIKHVLDVYERVPDHPLAFAFSAFHEVDLETGLARQLARVIVDARGAFGLLAEPEPEALYRDLVDLADGGRPSGRIRAWQASLEPRLSFHRPRP